MRIKGKTFYLWRAKLTIEGEVLESSFCNETAGSQGRTQVSETRHEALWRTGFDRHGQAPVLPGCDEGDRQ